MQRILLPVMTFSIKWPIPHRENPEFLLYPVHVTNKVKLAAEINKAHERQQGLGLRLGQENFSRVLHFSPEGSDCSLCLLF